MLSYVLVCLWKIVLHFAFSLPLSPTLLFLLRLCLLSVFVFSILLCFFPTCSCCAQLRTEQSSTLHSALPPSQIFFFSGPAVTEHPSSKLYFVGLALNSGLTFIFKISLKNKPRKFYLKIKVLFILQIVTISSKFLLSCNSLLLFHHFCLQSS